MHTLYLDEIMVIDFHINMDSDPSTVRFVIETKNFDLTFPVTECRAIIPRLTSFLNEGKYQTRLEVILNDRIYTPIQETFMMQGPVSINLSHLIQEPGVSVNIDHIKKIERLVNVQVKSRGDF